MFGRRAGRRPHLSLAPGSTGGGGTQLPAALQWPRPAVSSVPAAAVPSSAAAGSALALVVTDGSDGTTNGNKWYAWNESTQTLGAFLGAAGSIASDTEAVGRPNFIYGNAAKSLDCVVILPMDPGNLNPQQSVGLNADGGLIFQNWRTIRIVGGEFDVRTDFVRASGGIGLNLLDTSTTTTAVNGGGYHDERMRMLRIRDYTTVHIEGVKFGGVNGYEAIDVSHGNSSSAVLQIQRCQFGDPTNHIKNLKCFQNFYTANDGTVRQSLYPTFDHSGGDPLQCWTGPLGVIRCADNEMHTDFQALFLAWDDQSGSTTPPSSFDIRRNEIVHYLSTKGPWLYYDTKSATLAPPSGYYENNFIRTPNFTSALSGLVKTGSYGGGTDITIASGTYAGRAATTWEGTSIPAASQHLGNPAFIVGSPVTNLGPSGTTAQGRAGGFYDPTLWTTPDNASPTAAPVRAGMTNVLNELWLTSTIDSAKWNVHTDAFGSGSSGRDQQYQTANALAGQALTGATGGKGLKMLVRKQTVGTHAFTAAMLDSQNVGKLWPLYGYYEVRCQVPHGQGVWPSFWLTAPGTNGGATRMEIDLMEYFHAQVPGKNSITVYGWDNTGVSQPANSGIGLGTTGMKYTNNGNSGRASRTLFESPANFDAGNWHTWGIEILPVTDATGATVRTDVATAQSQYVRMKFYQDGALVDTFVDAQASAWTADAGTTAGAFFNIYISGSQVGGTYVGDPLGPLGYSTGYASSHSGNGCFNGSGTSPNACTVPTGARLLDWTAVDADTKGGLMIDYVRVWQAV